MQLFQVKGAIEENKLSSFMIDVIGYQRNLYDLLLESRNKLSDIGLFEDTA